MFRKIRFCLFIVLTAATMAGMLAFRARKCSFFIYSMSNGSTCSKLGLFEVGVTPISNSYMTIMDDGSTVDSSLCTSIIFVSPE